MAHSTPGSSRISSRPWSPFTARALAINGLFWLGVAVLSAGSTVAMQERSTSSTVNPAAALSEAAIACLSFAVLSPLALAIGQWWPIGASIRSIALHVAGALVYWLANSAFVTGVSYMLAGSDSVSPPLLSVLVSSLFGCVVAYAGSIGIARSLDAVFRLRQEQLRRVEMAAELSQARLNALTGQLRPHFLFNALNAVSALINRDPAAADRLVVQLGNLLRLSLARSDESEIPLEDEIAFLRLYLDVMSARIGPKLTVVWSIDDRVVTALVPQLILLPLVENSLKHGIARSDGPAKLEVIATSGNGVLRVGVADDGVGLSPEGVTEGIGLRTIRRRLTQLYGDAGMCELRSRQPRGTAVTLELPLRWKSSKSTAVANALHAIGA